MSPDTIAALGLTESARSDQAVVGVLVVDLRAVLGLLYRLDEERHVLLMLLGAPVARQRGRPPVRHPVGGLLLSPFAVHPAARTGRVSRVAGVTNQDSMAASQPEELRWLRAVGNRIRRARLTRALAQDQLAAAAGVSRSFVSLLEDGQAGGGDVIRLWRIADALGVPVIDLLMPPAGVLDRIEETGR